MEQEQECRIDGLLELPRERAFSLVIDRPDLWWASPFADAQGDRVEAGIEPFPGGACYEIDSAGRRRIWGTILSIEPPLYVRLAWQISLEGEEIADPGTASRVMFNFRQSGDSTRLEIVHSQFLRHGEDGALYCSRMSAPEGWSRIFGRLKSAARTATWR